MADPSVHPSPQNGAPNTAFCVNVWDASPSDDTVPSGIQQIPDTSSLAVAAALQYRQMRQQQEQKQSNMSALRQPNDPQAQKQATASAAFMMPITASHAAPSASNSSLSSSSTTGSSVSSLYGKLRSSSGLAQPSFISASTAAAAIALRPASNHVEVVNSPQLFNTAAPSAMTTNPDIAPSHAPAGTTGTDMLSLLLAATNLSMADSSAELPTAPSSTTAHDPSATMAISTMMPASTNSMDTTINMPPGLLAMDNSSQFVRGSMPSQDHMRLLQQLQQLQSQQQANIAGSPSALYAQAMQLQSAPSGLQVADFDAMMTVPGQLSLMQQQQQLQGFQAAGLSAGGAMGVNSDTNNNPSMIYLHPAAAAQVAPAAVPSGSVYLATSNTFQATGDSSYIQPQQQPPQFFSAPSLQAQQQLLQLQAQHGFATAAPNMSPGPASGMMGLSAVHSLAAPTSTDSALLTASSLKEPGDLPWHARAERHASSASAPHNPLYKTELCRSWLDAGTCRYGARCQFAHGQIELRPVLRPPKYKTQPCRTFSLTGKCPYGARCNFIHDEANVLSGLSSSILGCGVGASSASYPGGRESQEVGDTDGLSRAFSNFSAASVARSDVGGSVLNSTAWLRSSALRNSSDSGGATHSRTGSSTGLPGSTGEGVSMVGANAAASSSSGATANIANADASGQLQALLMQLPLLQGNK